MRRIMVANPKGGSGKSTLAGRPRNLAPIRHWDISGDEFDAPPKDCTVAILDTPAGLHGKRLKLVLSEMDKIVVPVSPSRFDMLASRDLFEELAETKAVRKERVDIAIVGMRVDPRTNPSRQLVAYLQQFDLPLITCIRQSQRCVQAVETGVTLFDSNRIDPVEQLH
jgi:chromosome partitioning protein